MSSDLLLAPDPDWAEGIEETHAFLTDVLTGYASGEQRIQLRTLPRKRLRTRLLFPTAAEASAFEAQLWTLGAAQARIPFWMDATPLVTALAPTDTTIACDTTTRRFADGGLAMLWRTSGAGDTEFEVVTIDTVSASSFTLDGAVAGTWAADGRTWVVPVVLGELEDAPEVVHLTSTVAAIELHLLTEPVAALEGADLTAYLGFDILALEPNRAQDISVVHSRSLYHLDGLTGVRAAWDRAGFPSIGRKPLSFLLDGRTEILTILKFIGDCCGQLTPFWMPSWMNDLPLAEDLSTGETEMIVKAMGYAANMLDHPARQFVALMQGSAIYYREVLDAVAGDPGTEVITLDSALPEDLIAARAQISFLTLVRQSSDESPILWHTTQCAEWTLETVEIPTEVLELGVAS
jgi:hypothetical protein